MRKLTAIALAVCMTLQSCVGFAVPVYGAEASGKQKAAEADSDSTVSGRKGVSRTEGTMEVQVLSSRNFPYSGRVSVELSSGESIKKTSSLDLSGTSSAQARFDVSAGQYTVSVKAEGFADYEQSVSVEAGWVQKVVVCSARLGTEGTAKAGWIRPGDVNGDKVVDRKDTEELMAAIREGSGNTAFDINGDGKVDLADLQSVVQGIDERQDSSVEKLLFPKKVVLSGGTTSSGGRPDTLVTGEGGTVLKPADPSAAVSGSNPVELSFTLAEDSTPAGSVPQIQGMAICAPLQNEDGSILSEIADGSADVTYIDENGEEREQEFSLFSGSSVSAERTNKTSAAKDGREKTAVAASRKGAGRMASVGADGSLVLNFGGQMAVKRVTIRITGTTKKETALVHIARVEFVNNMEDRISVPQLNIPTLDDPEAGNEALTVSWNAQVNVTGYEVYVSGPVKHKRTPETQIVRVSGTKHMISSINDESLVNFAEYTVKVRSVNGDWQSPWSAEKTGRPAPQSKPAPPDNVKLEGGYHSIQVSWKNMDDANGYMVYYKKYDEAEFQPVVAGFQPVKEGTGKLESCSYTIAGLEDGVRYSVYVIAWNELGWGSASLTSVGTTKNMEPPKLPGYKLLNTSNGVGKVTAHIVDAVMGGSNARMAGSPLDTAAKSALGLVDDDYSSYWSKEDWDDGVSYPSENKGMTVTLDDSYKMNYLTFAAADQKAGLGLVRIEYWPSADGARQAVGARLIEKRDKNDNPYYIVKLDETITACKIRMCLGRTWGNTAEMKVGEIHFHQYDSIEDDIMALYTDEMHTTLREDVTEAVIQALADRLEVADSVSGEKHPLYAELVLELKTAREILAGNLDPSIEVDNRITAKKDTHLGFGGLNAWQPLGKTAYAGESLIVYVGHNTKRTGDSTDLQMVFTQQHAESGNVAKTAGLKVGRNEITVPKLADKDCECGGQLYVAYTGNASSDKYAVRISGGSSIPVLNVYGKTGSGRTEAIRAYIQELEEHAAGMEAAHGTVHTGKNNVDYLYDSRNCILNATDIMMDKMMYSLPATQVLAGIGSAQDKVEKLDHALQAMEDMMTLFYQHKGLSDEAGTSRGSNALPSQHLNIRYMRMFAGAFMYAAGNHIGIEWGSASLASSPADMNGFGWGIAHEIGHNINQGAYAVAEITNNYFAQLLTIKSKGTRFSYPAVYQKVTSGAAGRSQNQATQLALYWQLHLAFDSSVDDWHVFDNYEEQFDNLFFARVDTYARNPGMAPQSGLKLDGNVDQNLMRLACAAADKNILPFFERWGMTPDAETAAYAEKYGEADKKALYYVNDDARNYRAGHPGESGTILGQDAVTTAVAAKSEQAAGQVEITISTDKDEDLILGYEIIRSMVSNGKKESKVVGFQPIGTAAETVFTDSVGSINNRVLSYEVRAVDKFLNYSNTVSAGAVKLQTDGVLEKKAWTVDTTMVSEDDTAVQPDEEDPDSGYDAENPDSVEAKKTQSIGRIIDGDRTDEGTYHGVSDGTAVITVDLHRTEEVTALKYQGDALTSVTVEVSRDGDTWTAVKTDYTGLSGTDEQTIWFDSVREEAREEWIGTYEAGYVRLTIPQAGDISIREIELCGPSGDNLEFMTAEDGRPAIGRLTADYRYGSETEDVIPAGSLVFTGTYKGNPAYNVVVLYDTEGNVIGAMNGNVQAKQVILAEVPERGELGETSEGIWVYYVEPGRWDEAVLESIQGVRGELYRVDDARTLEGERIVSDTLVIDIPDVLPEITLEGNGQ